MTPPRADRTDSELVRAAQTGDTVSFGALIERHLGMVYAIALARLRDAESADDLAQEVFLRAQLHLGSLGSNDRFAAWVSRIARNLAIDWLRRGQRASRLLPMVSLGDDLDRVPDTVQRGAREAMESKEEAHALREAIFDLPETEREVVLLHFSEGLSQREIAERLGLSQPTVSRQIQRALDALRGALGPALCEVAPSLRVSQQTMVRTMAIATAVGALSVSAKATLASSATIGSLASATEMASAGAAGAVGVTGLVKSLPALIAGGAKVMATGKGIAATVAAAAAITVGGVYLSDSEPSHEFGAPVPPHPGVFAVGDNGELIELALVPEAVDRRLAEMGDAIQTDEDVGEMMGEVRRVVEEINAPSVAPDARFLLFLPAQQREIEEGSLPDVDQVVFEADLESRSANYPGDLQTRISAQLPGLMEFTRTESLVGDLVAISWHEGEGTERRTWLARNSGVDSRANSEGMSPLVIPDHPGVFAVSGDGSPVELPQMNPAVLAPLTQRFEAGDDPMELVREVDWPTVPRDLRLLILEPSSTLEDIEFSPGGRGYIIGQVRLSQAVRTTLRTEIRSVPGVDGLWELTPTQPIEGDVLAVADEKQGFERVRFAWIERDPRQPTQASPVPDHPGVFALDENGSLTELAPIDNARLGQIMGQFRGGADPLSLLSGLTANAMPRSARLLVRSPEGQPPDSFLIQQVSIAEVARMALTVDRNQAGSNMPFSHTVPHEIREVPDQPGVAELILAEPLTGNLLIVVNEIPVGEVVRFALLDGPASQAADQSTADGPEMR